MESIKETLAKNQRGHLTTSSELVEKQCQKCGEAFQVNVWFRSGVPCGTFEKCPECRKSEELARKEEELQVKLKETIEQQEDIWFGECNMPSGFALKTFADFNAKLQPRAFKAMKEVQWQWDGALEKPPRSLVLLSPGVYGLGKTHLACALINQIIETEKKASIVQGKFGGHINKFRCPVYFTSENILLRRIRQTFNRNSRMDFTEDYEETEEDVYKKLARFVLLIIDDVGKVKPRDLNFLQGVYFNIIDQRYSDKQPIILTTNLDYVELETHIGGACADRLREMCGKEGFVKMMGKSYRH